MSDVKWLARWSGWCDPCKTERPLVLTETGHRGLRAWLSGIGPEDRMLTLTCCLCGQWQDVSHDDDDVAELSTSAELTALTPLGVWQMVVQLGPASVPDAAEPDAVEAPSVAPVTYPATPVRPATFPPPRASSETALHLVADGLDLITLAAG